MKKIIKTLIFVAMFTLLGFISGYYLHPYTQSIDNDSGYFSTVDCQDCSVIRITESVFAGPFLKVKPDKVWEVEVKPKTQTQPQTQTNDWSFTITDIKDDSVELTFSGEIYSGLMKIDNPINLEKWKPLEIGEGLVGGGASWILFYYQK